MLCINYKNDFNRKFWRYRSGVIFLKAVPSSMANTEGRGHSHILEGTASRTFLFLQGPASPFLKLLAETLESKGASVQKINVCLGDAVFWGLRASRFFRRKMAEWPVYLDCHITDHNVTDLVMLGDGRQLHAVAADIGIRRGIRVHILEHGYLRPDWLTIEPDGMSAQSRFPQSPQRIMALA